MNIWYGRHCRQQNWRMKFRMYHSSKLLHLFCTGSLVSSRHNPFKIQFPLWNYKSSLIHFVQASSKLALGERRWDRSFSSILSILFHKADKRPFPHYTDVMSKSPGIVPSWSQEACTKSGSAWTSVMCYTHVHEQWTCSMDNNLTLPAV